MYIQYVLCVVIQLNRLKQYLVIDVGVHSLVKEMGKLTDVSSASLTKLQKSPLIVSLNIRAKESKFSISIY